MSDKGKIIHERKVQVRGKLWRWWIFSRSRDQSGSHSVRFECLDSRVTPQSREEAQKYFSKAAQRHAEKYRQGFEFVWPTQVAEQRLGKAHFIVHFFKEK